MASLLLLGLPYDIEASVGRALAVAGHNVATTHEAEEAIQHISSHETHLVILNVDLTGADGLRFCADLRHSPAGEDLLLILLSHRGSLTDKLNGFTAGADDYVTIPFHLPELLLRVDALLRRAPRLANASANICQRHGPLTINYQTGEVWLFGQCVILTPVEIRILDYLIRCAGRPVSSEELLRHVWHQAPLAGDPALVRVHMQHLRSKLPNGSNNTNPLRTIPRLGYCLAFG